jgi:hypothetical protein
MSDYDDLIELLEDPSFPLAEINWVNETYVFLRRLSNEELVEIMRMSMCTIAHRLTGGQSEMSLEEFRHALLQVSKIVNRLIRENVVP